MSGQDDTRPEAGQASRPGGNQATPLQQSVGVALSLRNSSLVANEHRRLQTLEDRLALVERHTRSLHGSLSSNATIAGMEAGLSLKADQYVVDQRFLRFAKEVERQLDDKTNSDEVSVRLASKAALADVRALNERVNSFYDMLELKGRDMFVGLFLERELHVYVGLTV